MPRDSREIYRDGTHTRVLAAFYTSQTNGPSIPEPVTSHPLLGSIIGFTSSKQMGAPSGTWTLTFKKNPQMFTRSGLRIWRDAEDVWVKIKVMCDGQIIDLVLGMIDSIAEDTARSGSGQRSETYTITGRDFGKVFETTELFVNFFHNPDSALRSAGALTATFLDQIIGTPEHFIRVLLEEWVGNNGTAEAQWMLPAGLGSGSFYDMLLDPNSGRVRGIESMERMVNGEAIAPALFQIDQTGGKLWDVMQEYANGCLNELFVDLGIRDGRSGRDLKELVPKVYLRERPFPTRSTDGRTTTRTKWNQLRKHVLERGDVTRRNITKGGAAHRFNYWSIQLQGIGTEGFNVAEILQRGVDGVPYGQPGNIPIFSNSSIQTHGVRRYQMSTRFVPFATARLDESDPELANFFRLVASWLKKVHDWYVIAPMELSGRIETSRIFPEIRIGERLEERRAEGTIVYYVEGVDHRYTRGSGGSTSITVTRGEYEDEDLLGYIYDEYENPSALTERERVGVPRDAELDELLDELASGRAFDGLSGEVVGFTTRTDELGAVEGDEFTVDQPGQRILESERDGGVGEASPDATIVEDPGMQRSLDDSDPSVGNRQEIPPPGETATTPGEPALSQEQLERGEPIDAPEEYIDPIEGLEDAGF